MKTLTLLTLGLAACTGKGGDDSETLSDACDSTDAIGWAEESHAKGVDGNYDVVFPDDAVVRLDISMCADTWTAMQDDLVDLIGEPGSGGGGGPPGFAEDDPSYFPVNVAFDGRTWPMVGMRYKGNSSLEAAWQQGRLKLPFRLSFDQYEDEVPEVDNQRFWGFKELKFSSAYDDDSLMRDKIASETFREAGVPAARGGFVAVYVDTGDGPVYWGLYTMFEDPAGELLDSWFGGDDGNCYKPDGTTASLDGFDPDDFEKKTNEDEADFSDVERLVELLADERTDRAAWREDLEQVLDVDTFLAYLATNNLIGNWDAYGQMTHNYYLYGDPELGGALTWIPWDFNEGYRSGGRRAPLSMTLDEVGDDWPLIRRLMDDAVYEGLYYEHLAAVKDGAFAVAAQQERMQRYHELLDEWAALEEEPWSGLTSYQGFVESLEGGSQSLVDRLETAHAEAEAALSAR